MDFGSCDCKIYENRIILQSLLKSVDVDIKYIN